MKFETHDIVLAAYLVTTGYKIDKISIIGPNKGNFHFMKVDKTVVSNFMIAKGSVEPHAFNSNLKVLVTAVRQQCKTAT